MPGVRAVVYDGFGQRPEVRQVPDPAAPPGGVLVGVEASGLCRSDWHGWRGDDPEIPLPQVPGHEFAGVVVAVGAGVGGWRVGDRVTAPFVQACGRCPACAAGDQQVCERQTQPGFTRWGSFAEYVTVEQAAVNLVRLPDEVGYPAAALLGCRFATSFRAVVARGRVAPGEWVAVHGCGGIGLSAVMIAVASGARVVAVDISPEALALAGKLGAAVCVDASATDAAAAIVDATGGGAHLSVDALGAPADYAGLAEVCAEHGVPLVADSAPALGACWQGRPVGTQAPVHAFSLSFAKVVSAAGGGGALVLPASSVDRLRRPVDWTRSAQLSEPAAVAALDLVEDLDTLVRRRRAVAAVYEDMASVASVRPQRTGCGDGHAWVHWVARFPAAVRGRLTAALLRDGIGTKPYYAPVLHAHDWAGHAEPADPLPVTDALAPEVLALPMSSEITPGQAERVACAVLSALACVPR
jgi:alcohol dehydrogenase